MLEIRNLSIVLNGAPLFPKLSITIAPGEIVTLTGESGSGKSTLLNWIIGNLDPSFYAHGELLLNGVRCDSLPTERREIGILFQDDLLFPHLSVGKNLAFALPENIKSIEDRKMIVSQALTDIGLDGFEGRDPATLSGGQRARVSLIRSLLAKPKALLLDEPFSKLDVVLRSQFRAFIFEQIERYSIPTLLVTHDILDSPKGGVIVGITDH